ncbi:transposase-like protein [Symbiobacterium terraclitae]|uniref:Transposase-like protein n=1 Tax=Symbiobacterium terraclitae TaxID=557451 RepID=A0ABS4JR34_9FIRM|nr:non-oxidative hydroxyarylic acid decarboxylases subunit D [Symbiobacterium terraclitae]MBP2017451.1 transposase-like protein [Symbiobacterium terraclitae]
MICPRCDSKNTDVMVESPVGKVWTVYICNDCNFSWRNTESEEITNPEKYSKQWKLNAEKLANLQVIPPIPPLKK